MRRDLHGGAATMRSSLLLDSLQTQYGRVEVFQLLPKLRYHFRKIHGQSALRLLVIHL
jgi:hypothetical protein